MTAMTEAMEQKSDVTPVAGHDEEAWEPSWRVQLASGALCGAAGIGAAIAPDGSDASLALWAVSYAAGGWVAASVTAQRALRLTLDVHFLMLAVALGAAALGNLAEGAILLFLFSVSGALEKFAEYRTESEIHSLLKDAPRHAMVLGEDGAERRVDIDALEPGMRIRLRPGERVPADARVTEGRTNVDESLLTGESMPVGKGMGDMLTAGSLLIDSGVDAVLTKAPRESTLQRMVDLVLRARTRRAPAQRFADRFGSRYALSIIGGSLGYFAVLRALGFDNGEAMYRAMTLLVVASPCALVLSIPSAILSAIAAGARRGILFRGGAAVEHLGEADTFAFDKTGTLTTGELRLVEVITAGPWTEQEVLSLTAGAEQRSEHPIARSLVREARRRGVEPPMPTEFRAWPGEGVEAVVEGHRLHVGTHEFVSGRLGGRFPATWKIAQPHPAQIRIFVGDGHKSAMVTFDDEIRPGAADLVRGIVARGARTMMVSGDRPEAVAHAAREVGIADARSSQRPEDKLALLEGMAREGRRVAMVGDGVNDAAALAAAHVSITLGQRGSDAAIEESGIVLVGDRLQNLDSAIRLSLKARRIIRQNLWISAGAMAVLALMAVGVGIPLPLAVVGHEGSTVVVVLNSLRLLFGRT